MSKIRIDIPGWGNIDIKNIVIDLNGTIATDGRIALEVKEKINSLSLNWRKFIF
jgi:soluble P-type ATPase